MFILDSYRKHHAFELIQQGKSEKLSHMKLNHVINQLNDKGHSLLYQAIKHFRNDLSIIHKLLECPDLDINLGCENAITIKTPLYLASKHGHDEIVKLLLKHSTNNNQMSNKFSIKIEKNEMNEKLNLDLLRNGKNKMESNLFFPCAKTALYVAIENGHFSTAEILMGRSDIDINKGYVGYLMFDSSNLTEIHGRSILFLALKKAGKQFIKMILKKPILDPNFGIQIVSETNLFEKFPPISNHRLEKIECKTPLRIALDDHQSEDVIELLLENPKTNPNECQSFLQVCKSENLELVQLFMKHPNIDINMDCPLAYCLENIEIFSLFTSQPNINLNALDGLIMKNAIRLQEETKRKQIVTRLLQRKDLDINRGMIFYELCSRGELELVKLVVTMRKDLKPDLIGPNIKHTGSEGFLNVEAHKQVVNMQFRPIEIAYMNGHEELAQYLLDNTRVKPLDISKLLFQDEKEEGTFFKVNANGKRELSSGVYGLWTCDDDEDKSSVYSSKYSDF